MAATQLQAVDTESVEPASLLRCPIAVLRSIAQLLPPAGKKALRATCCVARGAVDQEVRHLAIDSALVDSAPYLARYKDACLGADGRPFQDWGTTVLPPFLQGVLSHGFPCLTNISWQFAFTARQLAQASALATRLTSLAITSVYHLEHGDLQLLARAFPCLHHLQAPFDADSDWPPPSLAPLTALSQLTSLAVDLGQSLGHSDPNATVELAAYLPRLPALRRLSLASLQLPFYHPDDNPLQALAGALPALEALTLLHIFLTYGEKGASEAEAADPGHLEIHSQDFSPLTTLTALHTNDLRSGTSRSILALPRLQSLTLDPLDEDDSGSAWFRGFPALTRNLWRALPAGALPALAALSLPADLLPATPMPLAALTALTVTLPACAPEYSRAVPVLAALLAAAPPPTLRTLHVTARSTDPAPTLAALLSALPALADLQLSHNNWSLGLVDALCAHTALRQLELHGRTEQLDSLLAQWLALLPARLPRLDPCRWRIGATSLDGSSVVVEHGELATSRLDVGPEDVGYLDKACEEVTDRPGEGDGETYVDEHGAVVTSYYDADTGRTMWAAMDDDCDDDFYGYDDDGDNDALYANYYGGGDPEAAG